MHHRPKISRLFLYSLVLVMLKQIHCFPTINQPLTATSNFLRGTSKTLYQPPELEETIEEVQKILAQDPTLPRLTRGEIEELYEKVTREEYQKSIAAGDMSRADSMRALMLVLPYNTDNNTEENLQELYTRPPVTKVIDAYTPPQPIKFLTPDPSAPTKAETASIGNLAATTYKPAYSLRTAESALPPPSPTTYHPPPPAPLRYRMTPSVPASALGFQPFVNLPSSPDYVPNAKPVQRFSSHYSAKNAEFLKQRRAKPSTTTVTPVADVLESLGIVGQAQSRHRFTIDDYYAAESAPKPVISRYVPQTVSVAELNELRGQSLSPQIKPDAYSSFKPLNIGEEIRAKPEVEGYLTRFGIVGGRKKKDLKKGNGLKAQSDEPTSEESEISTSKVPNTGSKARKGAQAAGTELEKLLENLQELERLNVNPKVLSTTTTARPTTRTTTTTSTTSTTTEPAATASLITNGVPMLIEAKKPRRRIDPNIDINFGSVGNQQSEASNADQLSKLLANLQELEKLKINPENVLKTVAPTVKVNNAVRAQTAAAVSTTSNVRTQTLGNRFSDLALQSQQAVRTTAPSDAQQLQRVLKELQALEQSNLRTTTTTTTTRRPQTPRSGGQGSFGPSDLFQLQKLLTDDRELERLYEQARGKQTARTSTTRATTTTRKPAPSLSDLLADERELERLYEQARARATSTTTTTTTTRKPGPSYRELEQLQKYFAELDRVRTTPPTTTTTTAMPSTTTSTSTSTSTTTTTTTTTTTPRPPLTTADLAQRITGNLSASKPKKPTAESEQLQELINRVQQLERLNNQQLVDRAKTTTTEPSLPFLGFTTRKINTNVQPNASPNDFAHLQQLYKQVADAEQASFSQIEISTAATASKPPGVKRTQQFAQQIIDITNDTGSGSSLQQVDPNDFVQLQKLLSKVQELERVKINTATPTPPVMSHVKNLNGAQIVYPEKTEVYKPFENILKSDHELDAVKLELPNYTMTTSKPHVSKKGGALLEPTSSEELRELSLLAPANPTNSDVDKDFEQYQKFFSKLEDEERNAYKTLQPPMIYKTVTKEPPRFIATHKPHEVANHRDSSGKQKADLEELQKLLNNAQELEKLGVTLPSELSEQIESKLTKNPQMPNPISMAVAGSSSRPEVKDYINRFGSFGSREQKLETPAITTTKATPQLTATSVEDLSEAKEKTAVFSLTTMKSLLPREPKPTTSSTLDLPIFSATKIIEAAIKRAANKIGVSTEYPQGFRRRSDTDVIEEEGRDMVEGDDDMMGEFSEFNYQLAIPEINHMMRPDDKPTEKPADEPKPEDITKDIKELQRLISNLQELRKLNISDSSNLLREADAKYLETLKKQLTPADDTIKSRRQSATPAIATPVTSESSSTSASDTITTTTTTTTERPSTASSTEESSTGAPTRINLDLGLDPVDASSDSDATTATTTEDSTSSTTEESRNGSLADLEDSFGPDPNKEEELPPKKKNGFYFLADWNSFLEVGDGDDQVVVRLSPKIGDPRLFIPVKIP